MLSAKARPPSPTSFLGRPGAATLPSPTTPRPPQVVIVTPEENGHVPVSPPGAALSPTPPALPRSPEARDSPISRGRFAVDTSASIDTDSSSPGSGAGTLNGEHGDDGQRAQTPRPRRKSIGGGLHKKGPASVPGEPKGQRWEDIVRQIFKLLDRKGAGSVSGWELSQMMAAMESDKVGDLALRSSGRRGARDVPLRLEDMRIVLDSYGCSRLEDLLWFVEGVMRVEQGMANKWTSAVKAWHALVSRLHAAGMHMIGCHSQSPEIEKWLMSRAPATKAHRQEFALAASRKIPAAKRGDALSANEPPPKHAGPPSSMGGGAASLAVEGSVDFNAVKELLRNLPHHEIAKSLSYLLPVDIAREHKERLWAAFERAQTLQQQLASAKRRRGAAERSERRSVDGNDATDASNNNSNANGSNNPSGSGIGAPAGGLLGGGAGGIVISPSTRNTNRRTTNGDGTPPGGSDTASRRSDSVSLDRKVALASARAELQSVLAMVHKGLRPSLLHRAPLGASQLWTPEEYDSEAAIVVRGADGLAGVEPRGGALRHLYGAALVKAGALTALVEMIDASMPIRDATTRHEVEESLWFGGGGASGPRDMPAGPRGDDGSNNAVTSHSMQGGTGTEGAAATNGEPADEQIVGERGNAGDEGRSLRRRSRGHRRSDDGSLTHHSTSSEIVMLMDPVAHGGSGGHHEGPSDPPQQSIERGATTVGTPPPAPVPAPPSSGTTEGGGVGHRGAGASSIHTGVVEPAVVAAVDSRERLRISEVVQAIVDLNLHDVTQACMAPAKRRVDEFLELQPVELETRTASDWLNLLLTAPDDVERFRALEQLVAWERRRLHKSTASWRRRSRAALALAWGITPATPGSEGDEEMSLGAPAAPASLAPAGRGSIAQQQAAAEAAAAAAAAATGAAGAGWSAGSSLGLKPSPLSTSSAVALVLARLNLATHASLHEHRGPIRKLLVTFLVSLLQGMGDAGRAAFSEANGVEILSRLLFGPCGWRRRHLPIGREDEELDDFVLANVPLFPAALLRDSANSTGLASGSNGAASENPPSASSARRPKSGSGYGKNSSAGRIQPPPAVSLVPWGVDWHYERDFADDAVYGARDREAVVAALVCLVCDGGVWGPKRGGDTLLRCPLILPALALHVCTPMSLYHALLAHSLAHENLRVLQDAAALSFSRGLSFVLEGAAPCLGLGLPPTLLPAELAGDWALKLARALASPIGRSKMLELIAALKTRADAAVLASLRAALRPESFFISHAAAALPVSMPLSSALAGINPGFPSSRSGSSMDAAAAAAAAAVSAERDGAGCVHHALASAPREALRPPLHLLQELDPDVARLVIMVAWQPRVDGPCTCGQHRLQKGGAGDRGSKGDVRQGNWGVHAGGRNPLPFSPPGNSHNLYGMISSTMHGSSSGLCSNTSMAGNRPVLPSPSPAPTQCVMQALNIAEWDAAGRVLSLCAAGLLHTNRQLAEQMLALITDALLAFRQRMGAVHAALRRRLAARRLQVAAEVEASAHRGAEVRGEEKWDGVGRDALRGDANVTMAVSTGIAAGAGHGLGVGPNHDNQPGQDGRGAMDNSMHLAGTPAEHTSGDGPAEPIRVSPLARYDVAYPPDFRAPFGDLSGAECPPVPASCNLGLALGGELSPGPQGAVALVTAGRLLQLAAWNLGMPPLAAVIAARAISLQGGAFVPDARQPWGESLYVLAPSFAADGPPHPPPTGGSSATGAMSAVVGIISTSVAAAKGGPAVPGRPGTPLDPKAQDPGGGQRGSARSNPPPVPPCPSSPAEQLAAAVLAVLRAQPGQGPLPGSLDARQVALRGGVNVFSLPSPLPSAVADAYGLSQVSIIRVGTYYPRQSMLERYPQGDLTALVTSLDRIIRALKSCAADGSNNSNSNATNGGSNSNNSASSGSASGSGSSSSSGGGGRSMQEQHAMLELASHLVFELSFTEGEELSWEGGPTGLLDRLGICTDDFRLLLPAVVAGSLEMLTGPAGLSGARGLLRPDRKERFGRQEVGFLRVGSRWHLWLNGTGGRWWQRQQTMQQLLQQHMRRPQHRRTAKPQASAPPAPAAKPPVMGAAETGGGASVATPGPHGVMEGEEGDDIGEDDEEESIHVQDDGYKPHRVPLQPITCGKAFYGYLGIESVPKFAS
eukprot:jgi/Mesvir1/16821/Mv15180-RA.1